MTLDDEEELIGSFTVDGLTYAVSSDDLTLVSVDSAAASDGTIAVPESVTYNGQAYPVTAIAPYAFYLSGVTSVELPATIVSVDSRAFRSSDVERVNAAAGNPNLTSFDGALYDASLTRLLLIPEGMKGSVLLSCETEVAEPSLFSHCSLVDAISVEEGGAAFSSWDGLLYDASGNTLLRVPVGATEVTIRDGCTTIAAGAMEGCAKLERINAPASVTSISPDVFTSIPTITLPAQSALRDEANPGVASGLPDQSNVSADFIPQLTALVAFSSIDDDFPEVDPSAITVNVPPGDSGDEWKAAGPLVAEIGEMANLDFAATYDISYCSLQVYPNGHTIGVSTAIWDATKGVPFKTIDYTKISTGYAGDSWVTTWHCSSTHLNYDCEDRYYEGNKDYYYFYSVVGDTPGWTLKGWGLTPTATEPYSTGHTNKSEKLYAIWEPNTYTIAFDANGGSGTVPGSIAATYDQTYNVAAPSLTRKGYTFDGWATSAGGSKAYEKAGPFKNLTPKDKGTVTLYARWVPIEYPVAFDLGRYPSGHEAGAFEQEGWGESRAFTVEDGAAAIPAPVRAGMRFLGWECDVPGLVSQSGTAWYLDATQLPDAASPTLTARWAYAVSVDTPASVTFGAYDMATGDVTVDGSANGSGLSDEWDVDAKKGAPVAFRSHSLCDVGIEGVSSERRSGASLIKAEAGDAEDDEVRAADLITMKVGEAAEGSRNTLTFALDDEAGKAEMAPRTAFLIPAGGTLSASFRLNLEECGAYVRADDAASEPASAELAQLTYAYRAIPYGTGSASDDMYIPYDAANPFGLADIKAAANDIAARGEASEHWWAFAHFMYADERDKTNAKVRWGDGTVYDARIIGLGHDELSEPVDGRTKAGITFQFVDALKNACRMNQSNDTSKGWGSFWLRDQMNNQGGTIIGQVPDALRSAILQVNKRYTGGTASDTGALISKDWLFLASYSEIVARNHNPLFPASTIEGDTYEFYIDADTTGLSGEQCPIFVKTTPGSTTGQHWWGRSLTPGNSSGYCHCIHRMGIAYGLHPPTNSNYVVPCFCL